MNALKLNRLIRGLSQDALAVASRVTQTTYSRIERGVRSPKPEERARIAEALGMSSEIIFGPTEIRRDAWSPNRQ